MDNGIVSTCNLYLASFKLLPDCASVWYEDAKYTQVVNPQKAESTLLEENH